jgi:hypothetical protein
MRLRNNLRVNCSVFSVLQSLLLLLVAGYVIADEGNPIAIRYWPGNCTSIETMWNIHIALGANAESRAAMVRPADVEFLDDFWEASGSDRLVLDRKPNETKAVLKPAKESPDPSRNAIQFSRVGLKDPGSGKTIFLNLIAVDGVLIVDSNKATVAELVAVIKESKELPREMHSIDVFLIEDTSSESSAYQNLLELTKPRVMVLRALVKFDKLGETPIKRIAHNTFAISQSKGNRTSSCVALAEYSWKMETALADLFLKKEAACDASRRVFAELTRNQMNFRPSNGTHTPRWNAEHMMGRELLFFSQIYHAVDSNIAVMDLNPKQMPPDYRPAHADWTGLEESLQMERVEAFTRRFAYLLDGMNLDSTAKGSSFWTPRSLLKQMDVHYTDHTANVIKKKDLPDWPRE